MLETSSILSYLDKSFQRIEMPVLGNVNVDYLDIKMSAYRCSDKWLLLFNSIVWCPAAEGLMTFVETVGTGVIGRQGYDDGRVFVPGKIEMDDDYENVQGITIRGEAIDLTTLNVTPDGRRSQEPGFWASVALLDNYAPYLFASEHEIARCIPRDAEHLISIEEWDHPTWETPPSQTESFPRIAEILVTSDPSLWQPVSAPNTHWSNWIPK